MPAAFIILFLSVVLIDNNHEVTVDTALRLPYPSCEAALSYRRAFASHWRVDCKSFRTAVQPLPSVKGLTFFSGRVAVGVSMYNASSSSSLLLLANWETRIVPFFRICLSLRERH